MSEIREKTAKALCWWLSAEGLACDCSSARDCKSALASPDKFNKALADQNLLIVSLEDLTDEAIAGLYKRNFGDG